MSRIAFMQAAVLALLPACLQYALAQITAPKLAVPDNVAFEPNIEYANPDNQHLQLDMARPKAGNGPFPAIVCIHGGGFRAGSRHSYDGLCLRLAQEGYVAVTVSYRLAPKYRFPAAVHDVKEAVRWLRANAKKLNIDPDRIGAMGGSAGGHLAQFLGVTGDVKQFEGNGSHRNQSSRVRCVVNYYGPSDFTKSYGKSVDAAQVLPLFLGGNLEQARRQHVVASPLYWVTPQAAPTLCIHGTKDAYVAHEQAVWLVDRLRAAEVEAELLTLDGAGHGFRGQEAEKAEKAMLTFFGRHLKTPARQARSKAVSAADQLPKLQRVADAYEGHVHPAICVTKTGAVLVAHFAENAGRIHLVRSTDGGRTWKGLGTVVDIGGGQPYPGALTTLSDGRILLTWNFWRDPKNFKKGRKPYFAISNDEGSTWTAPNMLPIDYAEQAYVRHAIWERSAQDWVIPMGDRLISFNPAKNKVFPFGDTKLVEGPLVRTKAGSLLHAGYRSTNEGKTWVPVKRSPRMNTYSCDMLALDNGWVIHAQASDRNTIKLVVSYDDGLTWTLDRPWAISDPARMIGHACHLAQLDANHVGIVVWDSNRQQPGGIGVYFMRLPLDELRKHTS